MMGKTLRQLRRWHLYIGMFFTPMLLLFAISGAFQTFRLNEAKGWGGPPPQAIVWLGSVHKDQVPPDAAEEAQRTAKWAAAVREGTPQKSTPIAVLAFKFLVVALSLGLIASIVLGAMIAFASPVTRGPAIIAMIAGTCVPALLILFQ